MSKIITITLSPVVDKSATVEKLVPEHKLLCSKPKFEPGGGGINVSRGLKRLNTTSIAIFPCGGSTGEMLKILLESEKIRHEPIRTKSSTRENFTVVETSSNREFRFGMPGSMIYPSEEKKLLNTIKKFALNSDYIVASGSLPPGLETDFFAKIASIATKSNTRFIVDTSGEALTEAVEEGVYLLKPNLRELSLLTGIEDMDDKLIKSAARELIGKGKCEVVVVSMGGKGAFLITAIAAEKILAPSVEKLSTVGAGDSMVAGMVYALSKGKNLKEMSFMGVACGTAATMNSGTELFRRSDAEKLFKLLLRDSKKQ